MRLRLLSATVVLAAAFVIPVHAADLTISGTTTYAALDGSLDDEDHSINGVVTVSGDLTVNGSITCLDGRGSSSACAMQLNVGRDLIINAGGSLYAENRTGTGTGGAITIAAGRNVIMRSGTGSLPPAIISSSAQSSSSSSGGAITIDARGGITIENGATIDSGAANSTAGRIWLTSSGLIIADGNILAGPSRAILTTRLSGQALSGGTGQQGGGDIQLRSTSLVEPAITIGPHANVISQGEALATSGVAMEGCGINIDGLVAALAKTDVPARVTLRSGRSITIDARELGLSNPLFGRLGHVRADAPTGAARQHTLDVFAAESIAILGPEATSPLYALSGLPGVHDPKSDGALVRITALYGGITANGNVADAGRSASGNGGGTVEISAKQQVSLDGARLRAVGDSSTNNSNRNGGRINVRSFSGGISWTNGSGDVTPTGSDVPESLRGTIALTICTTATLSGSSFPTVGAPVLPYPSITSGICTPASPSLPSTETPLVTCNTPPVANAATATTLEDQSVTVDLRGTDADGDPLVFTIVGAPAHGTVGPITNATAISAQVTYTPAANYNGTDAFTFQADDGRGGQTTAAATITITAVNDPPIVTAAGVTSLEDGGPQASSTWAAFAPGPSDETAQTLTFVVQSNDSPALFAVAPSISPSGILTYTSAANAFGSARITVIARDNGGTANGGIDTSAPQTFTITILPINDPPTFVKGPDLSVSNSANYAQQWATAISSGPANESGQTITFTVTTAETALFAVQPTLSSTGVLTFTPASGATGTATITIVARDNGGTANGGGDTSAAQTARITITGGTPPPDPSTVAPPVDPTVATGVLESTSFLYMGANPIQTGVAPGTITRQRAAVVRGRVLAGDGFPVPGVTVSIRDHAELGQTLSRLDGGYDLAVNGGGTITLAFQKPGFLPATRMIAIEWNERAVMPDVALVMLDTAATAITVNASTYTVARSSTTTDADGSRRATLLFPPNTTAVMRLPDGTTQPLSTLTVRATEYTAGVNGPKAMPAELPPNSGYTYCVELSGDEALAAGATSVDLSASVPVYVENFLGFPAGTIVPAGYLDRSKNKWVATPNGRVVKIMSITGGRASLDINGDGVADDAASIGVTDGERDQLGTMYTTGQSLWRIPVNHFTPWDFNWPYGPPAGAAAPNVPPPVADSRCPYPDHRCGSIIDCQNQALGESVPVQGTPFSLNYRSDRVTGRAAATTISITASGPTLPPNVQRIAVETTIAGRLYQTMLPAATNQTTTVAWDRKDAYGREMQGVQQALVRIAYLYQAVYQEAPADRAASFAAFSGVRLTISRPTLEIALWQEHTVLVGGWNNAGIGLGDWSLSILHAYEPSAGILYRGDGGQQSAKALGNIITTIAGTGASGFSGDEGDATQAKVNQPKDVVVGPDGSVYIADAGNGRVRKISTAGIITTVAGGGTGGDGIPATQSRLLGAEGIDVGPDGSIYIAEGFGARVRKVSAEGIISTIAGGSTNADGIPATQARLFFPSGVAVAPDGSLYIAEQQGHRLRRVGTDGIISTIAGGGGPGSTGDVGDERPAKDSKLYYPTQVALGPDGSIYVTSTTPGRIRRITPDGIIHTVAGDGQFDNHVTEGVPATSYSLDYPTDIVVAGDGSLYIPEPNYRRAFVVDPTGTINGFAGFGRTATALGDFGPPLRAKLTDTGGMAVGPDGSVYVTEPFGYRARKITRALPGSASGEFVVPGTDGEAYVFDGSLRHVRTLDTATNAVRYQFTYNEQGLLTAITDVDGRVTAIQRGAGGVPAAIVAPNGQTTTLTVSDGALTRVANPAGEAYTFGYQAGALMTTFSDPKQQIHHFTWDADGRLQKDEDPAGGFTLLTRNVNGSDYTITVTTALGRSSPYQVFTVSTGDTKLVNTDPAGLNTVTVHDRAQTITTTAPDDTVVQEQLGPDPRFAMNTPITASNTITTPSGLSGTFTHSRTATLGTPSNPFTLTSQSDQLSINGRTFTSFFDAALRKITLTSPASRQSITTLTPKGRIASTQFASLTPANYSYDALGRLTAIQQGTRTITLTYDEADRVATITDNLSRTTRFTYDTSNRVTRQTLPDGRFIGFTYDANSNVASVTPPGRPAHGFNYTPVDLTGGYTAPLSGATTYTYNADRQLTAITRPGSSISLDYDPAGRLATITTDRGTQQYAYDTKGRLGSITLGGDSIQYGYDGGLLTRTTWTGALNASLLYGYDNSFRVTSESAAGSTISFGYDSDSLLTSAGALTLTRNPGNGLLTGTTLGSVTDSWTYNTFGEPLSYASSVGTNAVFAQQFTRDEVGRIAQNVETLFGTSIAFDYGYDTSGRLTEVKQNGAVVASYGYDSNSNRLTKNAESATYDDEDRLLTYAGTTYTYAPGGELKTKSDSTGTSTYDYDALGNLRSVVLPDGRRIDYQIDGQNRRVGKLINGTLVRQWVYADQLRIIAELDGSGATISRFVYSSRANVPDYLIRGGVTYRILADHLGSPRVVLDAATGAVTQMIGYDEFGVVLSDSNPGFQPFGFAGGLYDPDTKLVRFGARDYDGQLGRWTAKDPVNFDTGDTNLYVYVSNDPVTFLDGEGQNAVAVAGGGVVLTGVVAVLGYQYFRTHPEAWDVLRPFTESRGKRRYGPRPDERYHEPLPQSCDYPVVQGPTFRPPEPNDPCAPILEEIKSARGAVVKARC